MPIKSFLKILKDYYLEIIKPIGLVMSAVVLTILWVVIFGIYAILTKLLRTIGVMKSVPTGWQDCPSEPPENVHYQF